MAKARGFTALLINALVLWQRWEWVLHLLFPVFRFVLLVSHAPHKGDQPPLTPCFVFRLPSRSLWVVVAQRERSSAYLSTNDFPQSLQRKRPLFARVFPFLMTEIDPHAGQQIGVFSVVFSCVCSCVFRVFWLVTDTPPTRKRPCSHLWWLPLVNLSKWLLYVLMTSM